MRSESKHPRRLTPEEVSALFDIVEDYTGATREQIIVAKLDSYEPPSMARRMIFVALILLGYTTKEEGEMVGVSFPYGGKHDQRKTSVDLYNRSLEFRGIVNGILRRFTIATGRKRVHQWIIHSSIK